LNQQEKLEQARIRRENLIYLKKKQAQHLNAHNHNKHLRAKQNRWIEQSLREEDSKRLKQMSEDQKFLRHVRVVMDLLLPQPP
jgi:hypothetical protein